MMMSQGVQSELKPLSDQLAHLLFLSCCFLTPLPAPTAGRHLFFIPIPPLRVSADYQIHVRGASTDIKNERC